MGPRSVPFHQALWVILLHSELWRSSFLSTELNSWLHTLPNPLIPQSLHIRTPPGRVTALPVPTPPPCWRGKMFDALCVCLREFMCLIVWVSWPHRDRCLQRSRGPQPLEQSTLSATELWLQPHLCISYLCFISIPTSLWPSRYLGLSQHLSSIFTSYFRPICWGNLIFTTGTQTVMQC